LTTETRFRTPEETRREVQRHETFLSRPLIPPTRLEIEREAETLALRKAFRAVDMIVCDALSITGCMRNAPEGS
jgi:hypothetical protein